MRHPTVKIEGAKKTTLDPADLDEYQTVAAQFAERVNITDPDAQFKAMVEEVGELADALNREKDPGGEIADVLVTAFVLADVMDVDVREEYFDKMEYNLKKTASKEGGKVTDDG